MIITDPAMIVLGSNRGRIARLLSWFLPIDIRSYSHQPEPIASLSGLSAFESIEGYASEPLPDFLGTELEFPVPVEHGPFGRGIGSGDSLMPNERRARASAIRALVASREGKFEHARRAFAEAASLDPTLDISRVPGFWQLPREAQQAAVDALYDAQRPREADFLASTLRYKFKPRLIRLGA